jgi:transcriptional regulator of acetoin/glycerol metabolism
MVLAAVILVLILLRQEWPTNINQVRSVIENNSLILQPTMRDIEGLLASGENILKRSP